MTVSVRAVHVGAIYQFIICTGLGRIAIEVYGMLNLPPAVAFADPKDRSVRWARFICLCCRPLYLSAPTLLEKHFWETLRASGLLTFGQILGTWVPVGNASDSSDGLPGAVSAEFHSSVGITVH